MSDIRFKDQREHSFTIGEPLDNDPVLVVCPNCSNKAAILPFGKDMIRASCFVCGYTAEKTALGRCYYWENENPTDGYFGLDLWLKTNCQGHVLWAFNRRHLNFLDAYVAAKLRERRNEAGLGWSNSSLASRLPGWIKSAKNRDALLKAIIELKAMV